MPTNPKQLRKEARQSAPPPESSSSSLVYVEFVADKAPFDPRRLDLPLPPPLQARVAALSARPSPQPSLSFTGNENPTRKRPHKSEYEEAWGCRGQRLSYDLSPGREDVAAARRSEEKLAIDVEERMSQMSWE